jgi:Uma2 family endonuclease
MLVAFGVEKSERKSYNLQTEKVMPQVIFEVASEQTAEKDFGEKYLTYAKLGVEKYYLLDPEHSLFPKPLAAYCLQKGALLPIEITDNRVFSPRLGLEIVDTGDNFRLFNPNTDSFLPSTDELAARIAELEALLKQKSS